MNTNLVNRLSRYFYRRSLGLVLVRLATGSVFFAHGLMKLENLQLVEQIFDRGLGLPPWVTVFLALLETVGGVLLIAGIATRVFGVLFGIEMLVAIFLTGIGRGWPAHELEVVLMLLSFGLALTGSGRWSLYKMHCMNCGAMFCDGTTCTPVQVR